MVIENFSRKVISSGVFNSFIATGFFATLIFFIFNSHLFTPFEMMFGIVLVTIALKGISNIMFSLIILLFDLKGDRDAHHFKVAEDKLGLLIHEMQMKEAKAKSSSFAKEHNK